MISSRSFLIEKFISNPWIGYPKPNVYGLFSNTFVLHLQIYGLRCIEYEPPNIELELSCINETEPYLSEFVAELGLQVLKIELLAFNCPVSISSLGLPWF